MPGLTVERRDGVEVWSMDFPPVNAIDPAFLDAFEARLREAEASESTSVVVVTSALRVFSAGADASWMAEVVQREGPQGLLARFNATMDRFRELCLALRRSDILFVAALNGHTLAGGLELAAALDLRFAADEDRIQIGVPEMKLFGVLPSGGGGTQYLSRLLGPSRCLDFVLEAEPCTPRRAYEMGIVQRLYAPDVLRAEAESFATRVAARAGRIGIAAAKRGILDAAELPLNQAVGLDRAVHWDAMRRGGFLPGVQAFVERFGRRAEGQPR
jgi:enoyl-CoA hydratase